MAGWKKSQQKTLRKVVFGMSESNLDKVVQQHLKRGWKQASDVKKHGYGVGMLMEFPPRV